MEKSLFAKNRKSLLDAMPLGSLALVPAASEKTRNSDVHYPFRQDSDFYYLTGFPESDALAVLRKTEEGEEYILFSQAQNPTMAQWVGDAIGQTNAVAEYGADRAYALEEMDAEIEHLLMGCQRLYAPTLDIQEGWVEAVHDWLNDLKKKVRSGVTCPTEWIDSNALIHERRLVKGSEEQAAMREAARISAEAHIRVMKACKPGVGENVLEAEFNHEVLSQGCKHLAYPSIVAAGVNACVLHYTDNDDVLKDGDLLLIDAGAEFNHYAADITRTYPISGQFSEAQKALYEVVLEAQEAAIAAVKPGNTWNMPHEAAVRVLTEGFLRLGLLKGDLNTLIDANAYEAFYMHRTGHWLGLDVHDVGAYKQNGDWRCFEPGMVLTVEPGVYVRESAEVDSKWWNIGIRIEDDILVTENGSDNLTALVPKTVADIEALMSVEG